MIKPLYFRSKELLYSHMVTINTEMRFKDRINLRIMMFLVKYTVVQTMVLISMAPIIIMSAMCKITDMFLKIRVTFMANREIIINDMLFDQ